MQNKDNSFLDKFKGRIENVGKDGFHGIFSSNSNCILNNNALKTKTSKAKLVNNQNKSKRTSNNVNINLNNKHYTSTPVKIMLTNNEPLNNIDKVVIKNSNNNDSTKQENINLTKKQKSFVSNPVNSNNNINTNDVRINKNIMQSNNNNINKSQGLRNKFRSNDSKSLKNNIHSTNSTNIESKVNYTNSYSIKNTNKMNNNNNNNNNKDARLHSSPLASIFPQNNNSNINYPIIGGIHNYNNLPFMGYNNMFNPYTIYNNSNYQNQAFLMGGYPNNNYNYNYNYSYNNIPNSNFINMNDVYNLQQLPLINSNNIAHNNLVKNNENNIKNISNYNNNIETEIKNTNYTTSKREMDKLKIRNETSSIKSNDNNDVTNLLEKEQIKKLDTEDSSNCLTKIVKHENINKSNISPLKIINKNLKNENFITNNSLSNTNISRAISAKSNNNTYKPYTLNDYKEIKETFENINQGGLGANIGTEDWYKKQEKLQKQKNYANIVKEKHQSNLKITYKDPNLEKQKIVKNKINSSNRQKAIKYCYNNIPKKSNNTLENNNVEYTLNDNIIKNNNNKSNIDNNSYYNANINTKSNFLTENINNIIENNNNILNQKTLIHNINNNKDANKLEEENLDNSQIEKEINAIMSKYSTKELYDKESNTNQEKDLSPIIPNNSLKNSNKSLEEYKQHKIIEYKNNIISNDNKCYYKNEKIVNISQNDQVNFELSNIGGINHISDKNNCTDISQNNNYNSISKTNSHKRYKKNSIDNINLNKNTSENILNNKDLENNNAIKNEHDINKTNVCKLLDNTSNNFSNDWNILDKNEEDEVDQELFMLQKRREELACQIEKIREKLV